MCVILNLKPSCFRTGRDLQDHLAQISFLMEELHPGEEERLCLWCQLELRDLDSWVCRKEGSVSTD